MLTKQQRRLLAFLIDRQQRGTPPSFDEMVVALNLKSKSGVHRLVTALEMRGFIRRPKVEKHGVARGIEVVRTGWKNVCPHCKGLGHVDAAPVDRRAA